MIMSQKTDNNNNDDYFWEISSVGTNVCLSGCSSSLEQYFTSQSGCGVCPSGSCFCWYCCSIVSQLQLGFFSHSLLLSSLVSFQNVCQTKWQRGTEMQKINTEALMLTVCPRQVRIVPWTQREFELVVSHFWAK